MATLFLMLIYLCFISLGLPDSMLGAAWPVMRIDLGMPIDAAGILTMVIAGGTIFSSLMSERVIRRFGTGKVTAVSVLATAVALLGFAFSPSFVWLIVLAVPLGLGAGAVDAALNNYVALHYAARHMSWLHSFWGIGASVGPMIMALFLQGGNDWRGGYLTVAIIQLVVSALLFVSLPLWDKRRQLAKTYPPKAEEKEAAPPAPHTSAAALKIPGVVWALLTFLVYCSIETSAGLWSSSFLVEARGFSDANAALGSALFFWGITGGRILTGFLTFRIKGQRLITIGSILVLCGVVVLTLPLGGFVPLAALLLIGIGCAPVYPSMIHLTPRRFGQTNSQKIIGWQMASAYTGSTFVPPLIGLMAGRLGVKILPFALLIFAVLLVVVPQQIDRAIRKHPPAMPPQAEEQARGTGRTDI